MRKTKKRVKKSRPRLKTTIDSAVEEHISELIEKTAGKKEIKQSIDAVVKKESKKTETKAKKQRKAKAKTKDVYGKGVKRDEYRGLQGAGVYDQIKFSPFIGFLYRSNIKANDEFYEHLKYGNVLEKHQAGQGEKNLVSSEGMDDYGRNTMLNFLIGSSMMTSGMNAVTFEEMEIMKFNLYDRTQNILYTAKLKIMGFGDQSAAVGSITTTLKTMHPPADDKAA